MNVLSENSTNWVLQTEDGDTVIKTKSSDLNQLLYKHNLWGLLEEGDEIWKHDGGEDEQGVTVIAGPEAKDYTIIPENSGKLCLGEHHKSELIDALQDVYASDCESIAPIMNLYDRIRESMIRHEMLEDFASIFGDKIEVQGDGWFINGHVLLTYEGDFYHPNTESYTRNGSAVTESASEIAYDFRVGAVSEDIKRHITVDGEKRRLSEKEIRFIAKAVWAIRNTPEM